MAATARHRSPSATADPFLPELEERLSNLTRAGFDATLLVRSAAAAGPLPDDHPAAALWWRILDQLPQTPNQDPATPAAVPATPRTTTTITRPAATRAALGAASRVRPEPLKRRQHHNAGEVFRRTCCRTLLLIKDGLFEVVTGIFRCGATTFR